MVEQTPFHKIPSECINALYQTPFSATAKDIMLFIARYQYDYRATGHAYLAATYIAAGIHRSERHVRRELKKLKEHGLLLIESSHPHYGTVWIWNEDMSQWNVRDDSSVRAGMTDESGQGCQMSQGRDDSSVRAGMTHLSGNLKTLKKTQEDQEDAYAGAAADTPYQSHKLIEARGWGAPQVPKEQDVDMSPCVEFLVEVAGVSEPQAQVWGDETNKITWGCERRVQALWDAVRAREGVRSMTGYFASILASGLLENWYRDAVEAATKDCTCDGHRRRYRSTSSSGAAAPARPAWTTRGLANVQVSA